ncbi:mechanosensitive ion channel family protein [Nafulsella turpanensis]|uniref:mechanosensitive ion channel family protein n=1 Tax=Nafulsella turpanensis TaxID=1265690 RepID=UPI00034A1AF3|nr:mechanosensitive ion channel family protein [Nafulsella turpanensis]
MNEILDKAYWGNTVQDYLIALGIIILGILLIKIFKRTIFAGIRRWTQRSSTKIDDFIVTSIDRFGLPVLHVIVVIIGLNYLTFTERGENIIWIAATVVLTFLVIRLISNTILLLLQGYVKRQSHGEEKVRQLGGIMLIINVIIWGTGILFLFNNLGYDVTAVVAGLGIGGIAIALAAQNILSDLFNYLVIFLDRPFEIGDFVVIDDKNGVIEKIGIKTTRIKTLSGEQLVFANSDLTNSRIHNYKKMQQRRVVFKIRVAYETAHEDLKKIPLILKAIVQEQDPVKFDRAHFASYGDFSLDFEVVYHVLDADYSKYMDIQQSINLRIFEEFEKMDIEIAYPTRTLYVIDQQGNRKESLSPKRSL